MAQSACQRYGANNLLEGHDRLAFKFKDLLEQQYRRHQRMPNAQCRVMKFHSPGIAHQSGTIRFGRDSSTSALDVNCKAHEIDNLYVVDGSFFVSSAAVNPALTIAANALRVAEHLGQRLAAKNGTNLVV